MLVGLGFPHQDESTRSGRSSCGSGSSSACTVICVDEPNDVRRPVRANTALVQSVLEQLDKAGTNWAPRFLGVHEGQEVLTWLPGTPLTSWSSELSRLDDLTRIIRRLHDSTTEIAEGSECLVHDDLQPRNVVVQADFIGLIDWEQLRPGRRVEDVAQLCWSFVPPTVGEGPADIARRWGRVLDVYGLDDRGDVVQTAMSKLTRCVDDIVNHSDRRSHRHQLLRDRGDHHDLAWTFEWLSENQKELARELA